jgi:DNA cross-link repair 1A protein
VVGSYLIGKEKVFLSIASRIQTKVFTEKRKMKVYQTVAAHDTNLGLFLTSNKQEALVHVVPMNHINHQILFDLKQSVEGIDQIVAFRPTGWTFASSKTPPPSSRPFNVKMLKPVYLDDNITVVPLPYSEHSSYTELQAFCQNLEIQDILPTVNLDPKSRAEMTAIFSKWKKSSK